MADKRIVSYDILNVMACIAVVYLHQNGAVHKFSYCPGWFFALGVECLCYFAVPVFFMLTGASLMRYDERYSDREFFRRRLKRTLIPFLLWSAIWFFIVLKQNGYDITDISVVDVFNGIINTEYQPVYWFFIPLFIMYSLLPLMVKAKDDLRLIRYLIILFFVLASCYTLYCKLTSSEANPFIANAIFGPMLYLLAGYYMSREVFSRNLFYGIIILAILSLIIRYFITCQLSINEGETNRVLFGYYLPTSVFPSFAVFLAITRGRYNIKPKKAKFLTKLATCSLGVYLLHKIVIAVMLRLVALWGVTEYSILWLSLMPILTYFICVIIVMTVKNNKIGNIIFP